MWLFQFVLAETDKYHTLGKWPIESSYEFSEIQVSSETPSVASPGMHRSLKYLAFDRPTKQFRKFYDLDVFSPFIP